jgi:hypothetical protein
MSHTNIRMGGCSTGRSTQKYTGGGGADLSSILAAHGDMIYADSNIEAANVSIGTVGHVLTVQPDGNVDWQVPASEATETVLVTKYPPSALPLSGYTATASDIATFGSVVWEPNDAFNGVIGNEGWHGPQNYPSYTNPPHKHVGSAVLGSVDGEWIKLELPSVMILSYIKIAPRNDPGDLNSGQAPKDLTILGSNDDSSWTVITSATNLTPAPFGQFDQITAVATTGYTYYAVVVTRTGAGGGWVSIGELEFWGTAGSVATVNLQQVTASNPQTNITVELVNQTTSLTASGNVLVTGNVTASKFLGSGLELTGVALKTDLDDNVTRISDLETATIISNSSTITTGFQTGDILYASANNVLNKLNIGSAGQVLKSDGAVPVWDTDIGSSGVGLWSAVTGGKIHYSSGNVGIGVSNPQHLLELPSTGTVKAGFFIGDGSGLTNLTSGSQWTGTNTVHFSGNVGIGTTDVSKTLSIGSNVSISDTGADKLTVAGNVHIARNLKVVDEIDVYMLRANFVDIKNINVVAERPRKS